MSRVPRLVATLTTIIAAFSAIGVANAAAKTKTIPVRDPGVPAGAKVLKYRFGPMTIRPGQNYINVDLQVERPTEDGWIVGFRPGLVYADNGKSPNVGVVHLHHAVWLVGDSLTSLKPTFAAGEEKTYFTAPTGYGWRYTTKQSWVINHMIHDLTGSEQKVYLTYTMYFIPDSAPQASSIKRIDTQWMDVEGVKPYPVFNALRGSGTGGRFTFPDQAKNPYPDGVIRNRWVADRDATLVSTAGHLHPGGLYTDLKLTRNGVTKRIFRSRAQYYEPAGPISWDVSMSATNANWKVAIKKGDVLSTTATYDTRKASWYEVMGIMVVGITQGADGGVDPFTGTVDQTDYLTHGRLPENRDLDARKRNPAYNDPRTLRKGPLKNTVVIRNFAFSQGDMLARGAKALPPTVRQGNSLTFVNKDPLTVAFHTVTACKSPCNLGTGIGYPLADGPSIFDSGELGFGPTIPMATYTGGTGSIPITAVPDVPADPSKCANVIGLVKLISNGCVGTDTWKTPANLKPGTYTYFCRVHPFMRGSFRVAKKT